ncbi:MAG: TetR/AcrR family transcriptional regulator [Micrococcales bacterium]
MTPASVRDERQNLILEAASHLVCEGSAEAVTMAQLAAKTGLSRPAIYQYFASREHVLAELVINEIADLSNEIDSHIAKIDDPMEQIRVWIHYSLAHLASPSHRAIREISIDYLPEQSRGMLRAMHGHLMTSLVHPLREINVADVTATCHFIYAAISAAATRISEGSPYEREAAALERFTIAGITQKPRP